ncbi:MAG: YCII-related protein [Labilithrix sp.]|nr:YCII-related protein [Labilithrix sp.]
MQFVILTTDRADAGDLRARERPAHRAYLTADHGATRVLFAGPFLGNDHTTMVGSLIAIEAADQATAETFAAADPYAKNGLFAEVTVRPWTWVVKRPADL